MRAIGIVLAGGGNDRMEALSKRRAAAAMPIAGSFRCVDFALSNMTNSHVKKVAVMTQYHAKSLNQHLNSSKWWDFGRKQGGLFVLTPTITDENSYWYRGTADAIYQNLDFLKDCHEPYVIITSGDCVYKLDYNKVLEDHIAKKADITVVYKELSDDEDDLTRFGIIKVDENGRVTDFEEKPLVAKRNLVSTGIYVIRRRQLIELIEKAHSEHRNDFVQDILVRYKEQKRIFGYKMEGYWRNISTLDSYFKANKDFLKKEVRDYFFKEYPSIYSKISDLPPAKFNPGANVKNSLISSGCIVNGDVEDSVLFKKVYVGNNCVIRNSIILNDVYIGDNTVIENCIVESRDTIRANASYIGSENEIKVVLEDNERYII
ncbi:MAG TPA: glucose-1-phosphate adenylyltransferase subunit GlgD [Candidatus Scybalocola faecigallinarum]|mgnify:CR=1 FL=1|uniref:Glucose-1-phosphate adenylyltransferase subunit GlgD n=1 Tax=Candidatus Scybalocola faecigallinarum TaxID=2840941 RepID=A0A9D1F3P5_9FIRM|nr:glucose-1-phosphate adenylyltransferase subunit GlgD [Candidatus Scybalocola faecigallinarum]